MRILGMIAGLVLILLGLVDGFETILQPRRVTHRFRFARFYYRNVWCCWRAIARRIPAGRRREAFLSLFGPLSLLGLFLSWVASMIVGFGLLQWSLGTMLQTHAGEHSFATFLYLSGTTFFTLGYGDVTPITGAGRVMAVIEAGLGFAFLAVIITYLPVLYQAFSQREVLISLLDARAGSPPSAAQFLSRLARLGNLAAVESAMREWERWSAELLESHLSFPVLSYYRSQHDNESWLAALTMMLDTCALLLTEVKGINAYQPQVTFAVARHAAVDLALILKVAPIEPTPSRLAPEAMASLRQALRESGLNVADDVDVNEKLTQLRAMYEPFVNGLAKYFLLTLPPILPTDDVADNWQRSKWMPRPPGIGNLPQGAEDGEHFG